MAETFIPEGQRDAPPTISLLTILKGYNSSNNKETDHRYTNVNDLLSDHIRPLFENIRDSPYSNEELGAILTELTRQVLVNAFEIKYTKHLIALLTFTLLEQGMEITDKELQENLKYYLKLK
jgi:hypothetical protein